MRNQADRDMCEYELVDIVFEQLYDTLDEKSTYCVCEENHAPPEEKEETPSIEFDEDGIPMGRSRYEIKLREKIIREFYAQWISGNPAKKVWNIHLKSDILVKYLSINETYAKASRTYESTKAVFRLTEILSNAQLVKEEPTKHNNNQKSFSKMLIMRYDNVKLVVGYQKTTNENVQYSITAPQQH